MNKVILLSRVSTELQDLIQQTETLKNYAKQIGYSESDFILIEDKESGVKLAEEERHGLNKLKEYVNLYPIKDVIVYELSRIARTPRVLYSIRDFLIEKNIQLHVLNPSFKLLKSDGTIDESANVIFSLFTSMAENEGYLRKQRFARGRAKSRQDNKFLGGIPPYGYTIDKDKHYQIKEDEAEIVRRIFKMFETMSISEIAKELILLDVFKLTHNSASTLIRNILHRERYCGVKTINNGYIDNKYPLEFPAIISRETFRKAAEKLSTRKKYLKKSKRDSLCYGLVYDINDNLLHPFNSHNTYTYVEHNSKGSKTISINIDAIDTIALHFAAQAKKNITEIDLSALTRAAKEELAKVSYKLKSMKKKIETAEQEKVKKIERLEQRYINGKISDELADKLRKSIDKEIVSLNEEYYNLEAERDSYNTRLNNLTKADFNPYLRPLKDMTVDEKFDLIHAEIQKIVVAKFDKATYSLGIVFANGEYVMCDYRTQKKLLTDEKGSVVNYRT